MPITVSETALLLVHLSVVLGFSRLYEDASFLWPLVGFVVGAHALAVVSRRRRLPVPVVTAIALLGAAVAASWLLFPATVHFGIPTRETWDVAVASLRTARDQFDRVAAPAPVISGFQLTSGLALWGSVWFADWAAFRLRATIEAVAPPAVLFVFCAMLGSGDHRFSSALIFTASVLFFVACHRAWRAQLDQAWLTTSPITGPRAVLRAGAALAVVGLIGGAVVGPRLPGSADEAIVRWRSDSGPGGNRTTVSPIVDLRKRLVDQTATPLFKVTADRPSYWRLTALDLFDGQLWTSKSLFSPASDELDRATPPIAESRRSDQTIEIQNLAAIWAPASYQARSLKRSNEALRWEAESSTLIVDAPEASGDGVTSDGLKYTVISEVPVFGAGELRSAQVRDSDAIEDRYEDLPGGFPDVVVAAARSAVQGTTTRYDQALALQNWFRSTFTYSLDVPAGHSDDALVDFLSSREGYCEQFAGAYAAMARSLGIPARVAVGFTPGERVDGDPDTYQVRGRHAHAWPEIWFSEVGWVPFEPTPGRGMPDAQDYTGVPPAQDINRTPIVITTSTTTSTPAGGSTTTPGGGTEDTVPRGTVAAGAPDGLDDGGPSGPVRLAAIAGLLAVVWLAAVLVAPFIRHRRRHPSDRSAASVLDAWHEGLAPVRWLTGLRPRPAETHAEFTRRAAPPLGALDGSFRELGALATSAAWDPSGASDTEAARAEALLLELRGEARRRQGPGARLRRRLSWREAFDRPRPA